METDKRCPYCASPNVRLREGMLRVRVVAFITEYAAVDRIIDHLKLTFVAEKPTSIRGKDYLLYARGSVDVDLFRKECREERKSKFLSPPSAPRWSWLVRAVRRARR